MSNSKVTEIRMSLLKEKVKQNSLKKKKKFFFHNFFF